MKKIKTYILFIILIETSCCYNKPNNNTIQPSSFTPLHDTSYIETGLYNNCKAITSIINGLKTERIYDSQNKLVLVKETTAKGLNILIFTERDFSKEDTGYMLECGKYIYHDYIAPYASYDEFKSELNKGDDSFNSFLKSKVPIQLNEFEKMALVIYGNNY